MKRDILTLLSELNACHGPAGDEAEVAGVIARHAKPYADEVFMDTLGNVIVHKKGGGPKVMFSAHMDSIGFIVTHIENEGYLRVGGIGGISIASSLQTTVRFQNGTRGVVSCKEDADRTKLEMGHLFLDIGAANAEEAGRQVQVGDTAVFDGPAFVSGNRLVSPYLDDRIACVIQLLALREAKGENDLYFVFSTQEEVGCRGARTASYRIAPDYGIAVDVTCTNDLPGSKHIGSTKLGGGAAVKVMDASVICDPAVVKTLESLARAGGIPVQRDVLRAGGTDAMAMQSARAGARAGGISIPTRYIHAPGEMADLTDVESCVKLVCAFAEAKLD